MSKEGCNRIALRIIEKEKVCFQHPIQEEDRRCSCTQKGQHPADVMHLRAKSASKQKDRIEDQQNVDAVGMQVQQVPDREPLPRGAQHCDHRSRKTERIKDFLAPTALMYGIVPANKDIDAAQVERQIGHVPLAGVKQDSLLHKLIS